MQRVILVLYVIFVATTFSSCATLFGKTSYQVQINSVPREAIVTIYNRKGIEIFSDTTPCTVKLKSKAGFFQRGIYDLEFNKEGFARGNEVITAKVNGWYYGNFFFGGVVGFFILDPLTGAMYKIETREIIHVLHPAR